MPDRVRTVILGAAGRDFHNFNVYFKGRPEYEVVAFTATQIPGIEGRTYPASLSGGLYPEGISILPESDLPRIIKERNVDLVILAYSDISHVEVMHKASLTLACGADFRLMGPNDAEIKAARRRRVCGQNWCGEESGLPFGLAIPEEADGQSCCD
jgi:predicted GTPase